MWLGMALSCVELLASVPRRHASLQKAHLYVYPVRNNGVCRSLGTAGCGCTSGTHAWLSLGYRSWHAVVTLYIQANGKLQVCRLVPVHTGMGSLPSPIKC